jgi:hypothetical protein
VTGSSTNAARLSRVWSPQDISDPVILWAYRAWLVSFPVGAVSMLAVLVLFGAGLLLHRPIMSGESLFVLLALAIVPLVIRHSYWPIRSFRQGYLTRAGVPVGRTELPRRYWLGLAAGSLTPTLEALLVGWLLWIALNWF